MRGVRPSRSLTLPEQLPKEPQHRIVEAVHHALLERDDRVVRDRDALRADFRAALRDVAEPDPAALLEEPGAVPAVDRVHLEPGDAHEEARARELVLELVRAQHVAD